MKKAFTKEYLRNGTFEFDGKKLGNPNANITLLKIFWFLTFKNLPRFLQTTETKMR